MSNFYVLVALLSLNAVSIDPPKRHPTKAPQRYALSKSGGIGATVTVDRKTRAIQINPIAGSPAAKAGIRAGDTLLAANGMSVAGQSLPMIINQIRGQPGAKVKLRIRHRGQKKAKEIGIVRQPLLPMMPRRPRVGPAFQGLMVNGEWSMPLFVHRPSTISGRRPRSGCESVNIELLPL